MDCCIHTQDINAHFDERKARSEVSQYLKKGPASHARALLEAVNAHDVKDASVLEVGGGFGGLQIELLKRGAAYTTNIEVSTAYLTAAQALAGQLGLADRVTYRRADFVCEADSIPAADIVFMHRVVCCYPDMPRLVSAAAGHARRILALSFPRNEWYVRLYIEAQALWMKMKGSSFRNYVHSPEAIFRVAADAGLKPAHQSFSGTWQIVVFER
ncbi:MAG TPA: methyltransferase domain-containing protein [Anaerolineales bacterium]|nr:methyltransferase domain-containing protein [Anaerolineales bacterium]HLF02940.1 methyltransferase domain-containing protein [Anaerolineales bacterium]